jgi:predicted PurR-regulated permease PerM
MRRIPTARPRRRVRRRKTEAVKALVRGCAYRSLLCPFLFKSKEGCGEQEMRSTTRSLRSTEETARRSFVATTVAVVAAALAANCWLDGLQYWLLISVSAGIVEIVPVIGPFAAGALAIGAGLTTTSWPNAVGVAIAVFGLRLIQDYVVGPRVLGHQ